MSLDVGYSYCINLTYQEKSGIDKQVRKNQFDLKLAIFFPFGIFPLPSLPMPQVPFWPVEGFSPQQIIRNGRDRLEEGALQKRDQLLEPVYATTSEAREAFDDACEKFTVYTNMSSKLLKVSKKVRKDEETSKSLDKLEEQLKNGEFHAGRGAEKLPGTKSIYYMRAGNRGRLFFRYSKEEKGAVEKLAESNKDKEQEVIHLLKQKYE